MTDFLTWDAQAEWEASTLVEMVVDGDDAKLMPWANFTGLADEPGIWDEGYWFNTVDFTTNATEDALQAYANREDTGQSNGECFWETTETTSLDGYSTMRVLWEQYSSNGGSNDAIARMGIDTTRNNSRVNWTDAYGHSSSGTWGPIEETLDISAYTGDYYLKVGAESHWSNAHSRVRIYDVWLE